MSAMWKDAGNEMVDDVEEGEDSKSEDERFRL